MSTHGIVALALVLGTLAHLVGDYILQSGWMAAEKTSRWLPAVAHAVSYGLPFLLVLEWLTTDLRAVAIAWAAIVGTHAVLDRYRLARHLCWLKDQLAPRRYRRAWVDCRVTGYPPEQAPWMSVWLMILADNTMHVVINSAVLAWAVTR